MQPKAVDYAYLQGRFVVRSAFIGEHEEIWVCLCLTAVPVVCLGGSQRNLRYWEWI